MRPGFDPSRIRFGVDLKVFADHAVKQRLHLGHKRVEIDHSRLEQLFATESEQLARQRSRLFARFSNECAVLPGQRIAFRAFDD